MKIYCKKCGKSWIVDWKAAALAVFGYHDKDGGEITVFPPH